MSWELETDYGEKLWRLKPYQTKALENVKSVPMVSMMSLPYVTLDRLRQATTKSSTRLSTLYSTRLGSSLNGSS